MMQYPNVNYTMMPQLQQPQNHMSVIQPQQPQQDPRMAQIGQGFAALANLPEQQSNVPALEDALRRLRGQNAQNAMSQPGVQAMSTPMAGGIGGY
jgi:hypothetical protein